MGAGLLDRRSQADVGMISKQDAEKVIQAPTPLRSRLGNPPKHRSFSEPLASATGVQHFFSILLRSDPLTAAYGSKRSLPEGRLAGRTAGPTSLSRMLAQSLR